MSKRNTTDQAADHAAVPPEDVTTRCEGDLSQRAYSLELAWLAGFMDGEGCIRVHYRPDSGKWRLKATVVQKDWRPLTRYKALFGGQVYFSQQRQVHSWEVSGPDAVLTLKTLLPYLDEKKIQAEVALKWIHFPEKVTRILRKLKRRRCPPCLEVQQRRARQAARQNTEQAHSNCSGKPKSQIAVASTCTVRSRAAPAPPSAASPPAP